MRSDVVLVVSSSDVVRYLSHSEFRDCMRPKYSMIFRCPCCCRRPLGRPRPRHSASCRPPPCEAAVGLYTVFLSILGYSQRPGEG